MKIYTGFGDQGNTSLFGGKKVPKHHPRVEFYGTLDELNSFIGLILSKNVLLEIRPMFTEIQNDLFNLSAEAASEADAVAKLSHLIGQDEIKRLEDGIDTLSEEAPPLKNFILPGGVETAALCHVARAVCRRAERLLSYLRVEETMRPELLVYLNRLSDLLFVAGRYINHKSGRGETLWQSRT